MLEKALLLEESGDQCWAEGSTVRKRSWHREEPTVLPPYRSAASEEWRVEKRQRLALECGRGSQGGERPRNGQGTLEGQGLIGSLAAGGEWLREGRSGSWETRRQAGAVTPAERGR